MTSALSTALSSQIASLLKQGLALHQQGQFHDAQVLYEQALVMQPDHFDVLQLLGALLTQTGEFTQAVNFLTQAIRINPNDAACYSNRGVVLQELGFLEQALASCDEAIRLKSDYAEAHYNRGVILQGLRRSEEALASYDQAISLKPGYAGFLSNRSVVLQELGRLEEALESSSEAIGISPNHASAHSNHGVILKELGRLEEALASYDKAISINPDYADAYSNRGVALHALLRAREALVSCDKALSINPDYADAHSNRGVALYTLLRVEEALASYTKAIQINPDHADAHANRGIALHALLRVEEALASYTKALSLKPDSVNTHWNLSLGYLLKGNFQDGWPEYEWGWGNTERGTKRNCPQPLWLGTESLQDKTILLYAEQGLGDTIQFCRYVSLVAQLGAKVILEVKHPLVILLKDLEGLSQIIPAGNILPEFDYHCPLLSLPLAFQTELHSIPPVARHIGSNPEKLAKWRTKLGEKEQPRVGLVWSGSLTHKNDHHRSLTLAQLLPHLPPHFEYVSLQKEVRDIDAGLLKQHQEIKYFGDALEDFTDTAALCELMDLIISVDTSVAHLAATLGRPTWVLLPYCPDWRWLLGRDDSPWYLSAKLYRQEQIGDWSGVLEKLKSDLFSG